MSATRVKVYMTPTCPYCQRAIGILNDHDIPFDPLDVQARPELRAELSKMAGRSDVPQIFVDGEHIGDDDHIAEWAADGRLDALKA